MSNKVVLDGARLRDLRQARGLTSQADLARETSAVDVKGSGLAPRSIWDAENERPVSRRTHALIAKVLEVDPNELIKGGALSNGRVRTVVPPFEGRANKYRRF